MRLREIPILLIAPLGLAAALIAHGLLQAVSNLGLGAPGFKSHGHAAVEPVVVVEAAFALWLFGVALRDALTIRAQPHYKLASRPRIRHCRLILCAGLVALIATAALFGMEYSETGSAAFALGWLGGSLMPGVLALATAVASAVATLYLALAGHFAGFDHLIGLFAAALARFIATLLAPLSSAHAAFRRRLTVRRMVPVARHAGLRAPPITMH